MRRGISGAAFLLFGALFVLFSPPASFGSGPSATRSYTILSEAATGEGKGTPSIRVETFDGEGRLVFLGDTVSEKTVSSEYSYDSAGRLIEIVQRAGSDSPSRRTVRRFGPDGRLAGVEVFEEGELLEMLALSWNGAGHHARAVLLRAEGQTISAAKLTLGQGAAEGRILWIEVFAEDGGRALLRSFGWDSEGRLVRVESRPAITAAEGAQAPAGNGTQPEGEETAGDSKDKPGIADLLGPFWPGEGPEGAAVAIAPSVLPADSPHNLPLRFVPSEPLPFPMVGEGRAEFFRDGAGRILQAVFYDLEGRETGRLERRYDERGLLAEERRPVDYAAGDGLAGKGGAGELRLYEYEEGAAPGTWVRRTYRLAAGFGDFVRELIAIESSLPGNHHP